ncbi:MAG: GxxExxY protein [Bacteroidetes bacterium]|nr:GxxExxY protein [Bacteroidota bacterium]
MLHEQLTDTVIKCFYKVYNTLGYGFLEKVYQNALSIELRKQGLKIEKQIPIKVFYGSENVGDYIADLIVENLVILELKAGEGVIIEEHEAQLTNYLRATNIEVGLVLFFGKKPMLKRKIFENKYKVLGNTD